VSDGKPLIMAESIVRRVERARAECKTHRAERMQELDGNPSEVAVARFGGVTALRWPPNVNRVMMLDTEHAHHIDAILAFYFEAWQSPDFDVLPLVGNASLLRQLAASGFHQSDFQSVLVARPEDVTGPEDDGIQVELLEGGPSDAWLDLYRDAHDWNYEGAEWDKWKTWLRAQHTGDQWRLFQAKLDGRVIGMATLFMASTGVGYFSNAATHPEFRRRGVHGALVKKRAEHAQAEGCELVASNTRPYCASQKSLECRGLRIAYQRVRWTRPS